MIREREESIIQQYWSYTMGIILPLAYLLDWGWLRIGPPYIYLNIDPVIVHIGPAADITGHGRAPGAQGHQRASR